MPTGLISCNETDMISGFFPRCGMLRVIFRDVASRGTCYVSSTFIYSNLFLIFFLLCRSVVDVIHVTVFGPLSHRIAVLCTWQKYLLCYSDLTRVLMNHRQFKVSGRGFLESGKFGYHSIALLMFYKISFGLNSIKPSVELKIGRNDKVGKRWRARYSSSFWNY